MLIEEELSISSAIHMTFSILGQTNRSVSNIILSLQNVRMWGNSFCVQASWGNTVF